MSGYYRFQQSVKNLFQCSCEHLTAALTHTSCSSQCVRAQFILTGSWFGFVLTVHERPLHEYKVMHYMSHLIFVPALFGLVYRNTCLQTCLLFFLQNYMHLCSALLFCLFSSQTAEGGSAEENLCMSFHSLYSLHSVSFKI